MDEFKLPSTCPNCGYYHLINIRKLQSNTSIICSNCVREFSIRNSEITELTGFYRELQDLLEFPDTDSDKNPP